MSIAGDLTNSSYWEDVWATCVRDTESIGWVARFRTALLTQARKVSQWKYNRMVRHLLDAAPHSRADVLELGCAPGTMLQRIHRLQPKLRLSGVDYAEEGCRTTAATLKSMGLPANVYHGDVRTTQLSTQFDVVMSFGLIEHFDDPAEIIRCHSRFCRPGGTVAITVPNFTSPIVKALSSRFCPDNLAIHNLQIMNQAALRSAFQTAGLSDISVGGDGGHQLHNVISKNDLASRAYVGFTRIWNATAVAVPPQLGWNSYLWAMGKVS
jgi:2-polyprenyl-3-methyl-5-hydroxy-6-metoxy-1,4-benzoquinol methylase